MRLFFPHSGIPPLCGGMLKMSKSWRNEALIALGALDSFYRYRTKPKKRLKAPIIFRKSPPYFRA